MQNKSSIEKQINSHGFKIKKQYGQNFLNDNNIVDKIVNSIDASSDDLIIEIGPGSGIYL